MTTPSGEVDTLIVVLFNGFQGLVVWAPLETAMHAELLAWQHLRFMGIRPLIPNREIFPPPFLSPSPSRPSSHES
ncbi:hypothetical protein TgHK011_006435 [Trichoderma gracile]|nr:hypothetical protein TgHK011_006435 [Trichoderma gracile]